MSANNQEAANHHPQNPSDARSPRSPQKPRRDPGQDAGNPNPADQAPRAPGPLELRVLSAPHAPVEACVDLDISAFEQWLTREQGMDPLAGIERTILKTYLGYKLGRFGGET